MSSIEKAKHAETKVGTIDRVRELVDIPTPFSSPRLSDRVSLLMASETARRERKWCWSFGVTPKHRRGVDAGHMRAPQPGCETRHAARRETFCISRKNASHFVFVRTRYCWPLFCSSATFDSKPLGFLGLTQL